LAISIVVWFSFVTVKTLVSRHVMSVMPQLAVVTDKCPRTLHGFRE